MMTAPQLPPSLADRPYDDERGIPVPFVHEYDDGTYDLAVVNQRRAVQCALSRVCAMCAQSLGYPLAFLGDREAAGERTYTYPPMHVPCAEAAVRLYPPPVGPSTVAGARPIRGAHAAAQPHGWVMLTTGSFDVQRPTRRGDPIVFRPAPGEVRHYDAKGDVAPGPGAPGTDLLGPGAPGSD